MKVHLDVMKMKLAIIGKGNVGSTLARGLAKAGHEIVMGVRNPSDSSTKALVSDKISAHTVSEATKAVAVIIIAAHPPATKNIVDAMGDVSNKIIIDAMNSIRSTADSFSNTSTALVEWTNCPHVVKCFNTTGYENMADPIYDGTGIDMFVAGDSEKGKNVAIQLAKDLGFENVYDFGGNDKFDLIEQFALSWINLAIMQGIGRNIAFKIVKRG